MAMAVPPHHYAWIEERTGCVLSRNSTAIAAVDDSGAIRGMVAYDMWTENAVQCHMAVDTPVAWRALLPAVFVYPFQQAGRGVILAVIPAGNAKSIHLAQRFGFKETHRVKDGWALGEDLVALELRRDDCRFLKEAA